jgi:hypothetical protein
MPGILNLNIRDFKRANTRRTLVSCGIRDKAIAAKGQVQPLRVPHIAKEGWRPTEIWLDGEHTTAVLPARDCFKCLRGDNPDVVPLTQWPLQFDKVT